MPSTFEVAYVKQQTTNLIIVLVTPFFRNLSYEQQCTLSGEVLASAKASGMRGQVAFVWMEGEGNMNYWAPKQFEAFFGKLKPLVLVKSLNRKLTVGS
jgi:hypothetical protein